MPLPTSVQIGPYRYRISADADEHRRVAAELERNGLAGTADHKHQLITLDADAGMDQQRDTLLHEILHGCCMVAQAQKEKLREEEWICLVTPTLLDTLRRNPEVAAWLLAE